MGHVVTWVTDQQWEHKCIRSKLFQRQAAAGWEKAKTLNPLFVLTLTWCWEASPSVFGGWHRVKMLNNDIKPVWSKWALSAPETLKLQRKPKCKVSLIGNQLSRGWQQKLSPGWQQLGLTGTQLCGRRSRWLVTQCSYVLRSRRQFAQINFESCAVTFFITDWTSRNTDGTTNDTFSVFTFHGIFPSCKFSIFDSRDIPGDRLLSSQIPREANGLSAMVDCFFFLFLGPILFVRCRFFITSIFSGSAFRCVFFPDNESFGWGIGDSVSILLDHYGSPHRKKTCSLSHDINDVI